jgi:hypothetical protein
VAVVADVVLDVAGEEDPVDLHGESLIDIQKGA